MDIIEQAVVFPYSFFTFNGRTLRTKVSVANCVGGGEGVLADLEASQTSKSILNNGLALLHTSPVVTGSLL